ncbi:GMP synthase - Glutamine amidotransferase domain [Methanonatronarchaeum thermophilum]|uniref:GMP synthase [glutamine-hydrolyzing] subunit A n=1 Tax=Methanonatronarchaeum thermophilum TaxID=1927129 RepID=A0A1Y3GCH8_9EURY|nr:GMP synthase subunit A [Methanonatronarchaeum thermophilum]OUJ18957.1 GMP synthase - Glutamine amidotransferase domain [Methanonatronarchaeum thermophilum]
MIIIVNNHGQFTHLIHRSLRDIGVENKLVPNTIPIGELLDLNPSGVILSGGPDIEKTGNCKEIIRDLDVPLLGICLGHQVIAEALGGEVVSGNSGGYAEVDVEILKKDGIFSGLGDKTVLWASHSDEVSKLPAGFEVTASSDVCDIEGMAHTKKPIYGVQGHPEVAHSPDGIQILKNFVELCRDY